MADPRRLRELLGFGYGAPSPAMSALQPFHAGVDPAYMPQDVVTESPWEGPRSWVRSGLESLFGAIAPSDRAASNMAEKVTNLSDFVNVPQEAFDIGTEIGNTLQGGDPRMLAMSLIPGKAADELVPAVKAAQKQIRAYHGSPHGFEKFDLSKIGTGEGAQAYGHGLYFAENEAVAQGYREALSHNQDGWPNTAKKVIKDATGIDVDDDAARIFLAQTAQNDDPAEAAKKAGWASLALRDLDRDKLTEAAKAIKDVKPGHTYEVNINADPDAFLDWDKPLLDQGRATDVIAGTISAEDKKEAFLRDALGGKGLSEAFRYYADPAQATEALKKAGIPGIKYLDAGSRNIWNLHDPGTGKWEVDNAATGAIKEFATREEAVKFLDAQKSRNYVVFSDEIIDIVKKYGIAGALGAGLITQQMADQLQAQQGGGQS